MKLQKSIRTKLLVILMSGLILSYSLLIYLVIERETKLSFTHAVDFARESAQTIANALKESMNEGNAEITARFLEKMTGDKTLGVEVTDPNGRRVFRGEGVIKLPDSVLNNLETSHELKGSTVFFYMPLKSEQSCKKCHLFGNLRGVVIVSIPFLHVEKEIADTRMRLLLYGILVMVVSVFILYFVVNKFIAEPIRHIKEGMDAYKEGNFRQQIRLEGDDEFSDVSETFNNLVEQLNAFHENLEKMVSERTIALEESKNELYKKSEILLAYSAELKTIASLPYRFVCSDDKIKHILQNFAISIRDELNYELVEIYYIYKYTESISRVAASKETISLRDVEGLKKIIFAGEIVKETENDGRNLIYLPIYLPKKAHCWEINKCGDKDCAVFGDIESKCWLVPKTVKCKACNTGVLPNCFSCEAFPVKGLLIAASISRPSEHSLGALGLVALELAYISDMHELLYYERNMVRYLKEIHSILIDTSTASNIRQLFSILKESEMLKELFDGLALWLYKDEKGLILKESSLTEDLRTLNIENFFPQKISVHPVEIYDIHLGDYYSAILCPLIKGDKLLGIIGLFKFYKRMFRPEEKAVAALLSQQIYHNIENIRLNKDLENQYLELGRQQDFTQTIFNSINSGIIVIDEAKVILTANPYTLSTLGFSENELIGSSIDEIIPEFFSFISSGQYEGLFTLSNNKTIFLGFAISHLKDTGTLSGKIIHFRDLTEVINLRNQLKRKEYFSVIGEMASWVAHEVKNTLFAIASIARILMKQTQGTEKEKFSSSILMETERLNALIDDLLQYGRPLDLNIESVMVNEFLSEIIEGIRSFASETGSVIKFITLEEDFPAFMDEDRMKQVFYNLIKNSIDIGAAVITITIKSDGKFVTFSVRDNGKGIKSSDISKVFTPFFTTKKTGTGLGLPICKKIVEEHGGTISIFSEFEHGAEVIIELIIDKNRFELIG